MLGIDPASTWTLADNRQGDDVNSKI